MSWEKIETKFEELKDIFDEMVSESVRSEYELVQFGGMLDESEGIKVYFHTGTYDDHGVFDEVLSKKVFSLIELIDVILMDVKTSHPKRVAGYLEGTKLLAEKTAFLHKQIKDKVG